MARGRARTRDYCRWQPLRSGLYVISANKALRTICASPLCTQFKQAVLSERRLQCKRTIMRSSILCLLAVGATSFAAPPLAKPPRFQQRRLRATPNREFPGRFSTEGRRRGPRRPAVLITTRHDAVVCVSHETGHSSTAPLASGAGRLLLDRPAVNPAVAPQDSGHAHRQCGRRQGARDGHFFNLILDLDGLSPARWEGGRASPP